MGALGTFEKEKLVIGIIYHEKDTLENAIAMLREKFGEIDFVSEEYSFSREYSSYYDDELGGEGKRFLISFEKCVDPSLQADIKTFTNSVESTLSTDGKRKINLDPGLMNHGRFQLSTTKDASFRIPLKDGIYTEMTLYFARGRWQKFIWTYMDYQSELVQGFLFKVRKRYLEQRKEF